MPQVETGQRAPARWEWRLTATPPSCSSYSPKLGILWNPPTTFSLTTLGEFNPYLTALSIKSKPPTAAVQVHISLCTIYTPDRYAFCAPRTQHGTGSLFFMSVLALALAPTLGQAHFSTPFPPGCPLRILSLILFNLDNGKCSILASHGWPIIALVIVRRVGQIKESLITSTWFLSSN